MCLLPNKSYYILGFDHFGIFDKLVVIHNPIVCFNKNKIERKEQNLILVTIQGYTPYRGNIMRYEVNKVYSYRELGSRAQSALRRKVSQLSLSGVSVPELEQLSVKYVGIWPSSKRHSGGPMFNIMSNDNRLATSFIASPVI